MNNSSKMSIDIYRSPDGEVLWTPKPPAGSKLIASCPTWEAAKSACRLLSMGEWFDGGFNHNGKFYKGIGG